MTLYELNRLHLGIYMYIFIHICVNATVNEKGGHEFESEKGEYGRIWRKERIG